MCAPRFGAAEDAVLLSPEALARPLFHADSELLAILLPHAERRLAQVQPRAEWAPRVVQTLRAAILSSDVTLVGTARGLGVSKRSLQGCLRGEGTTFQEILDGVRRSLATRFLRETDHGLTEIAFMLGYSDHSAFTRAFRRWTGSSPRVYRVEAFSTAR